MKPGIKWLRAGALGLAFALACELTLGQATAPPPATASASGLAYITQARPEIVKLPVAPVAPRTGMDLKLIQDRVEAVMREALPATVGIQMPEGQGSGVIVSKDGYVLTAGHVSGKPGTPVSIVLSNGQRVMGTSLGANHLIDSGMVKISTPGEYPFVPLGSTRDLVAGQWAVALGHPGGYQRTRPPVLRLGRILTVKPGTRGAIGTDCTLINGDSGGPVFDLDGRLIGINSRIGVNTTMNIHVPIDTFMDTWTRLAKGEEWGNSWLARSEGGGGGGPGRGLGRGVPAPEVIPAAPRLGVDLDVDSERPRVWRVVVGTAAEGAGLKEGDIVTKFDGQIVKTADDLKSLLSKRKPGDLVAMEILRGTTAKQISLKLGSEN